ncbi:hypothetical protein VTN77DRAFT_5230 [Rasamsonia byssochlamydoides]|uniref:uncharacterized protein n=1 Tax=Rasamsonia byssochlamydoides TaxID=89139 RepID=UPI003744495A
MMIWRPGHSILLTLANLLRSAESGRPIERIPCPSLGGEVVRWRHPWLVAKQTLANSARQEQQRLRDSSHLP